MGVKGAQDEFQQAMSETFGDIKKVLSISEDTVIVGFEEDGSDHDKALLERARSKNGKFSLDKLVVRAQEIFLWSYHKRWSETRPKDRGDRPDEVTKRRKTTSEFPGASKLLKFSPQLAMLTKPLRDLLSTKTQFIWTEQEQMAFNIVKEEIGKAIVLKY